MPTPLKYSLGSCRKTLNALKRAGVVAEGRFKAKMSFGCEGWLLEMKSADNYTLAWVSWEDVANWTTVASTVFNGFNYRRNLPLASKSTRKKASR